MDTPLQVIDAFVDGERVDVTTLKAALADAPGRDYFVDLWLLREAALRESTAESVAPPVPPIGAPRRTPSRWLVAAAIASALIGGYAIGYGTTGRALPQPVPTSTPAIAVSAPSAFPVPAPTRVIQLDFHPATTTGGD